VSQRSDPKVRALEVCLQGIQADVGPEQVLAAYPRWADELRPLIWTALSARNHASAIQTPALSQENSRAGFIQISQRMLPLPEKPWLVKLVRTIILFLILAVLLAGLTWAAETFSRPALPGSLLHPVKLACEQIRLSLTKNPVQHLALELAYDQERLSETRALIQRSLTAKITLVGNLSETEYSQQGVTQWLVDGIPVHISPTTEFMGNLEPGYAVSVQGDLQADGSVLAQSLRMREYILTGIIQSITADQLQLANIPIQLTPQTLIMGIPSPGSHAQAILRRSFDWQLHARLVEILP
jgi:hypothetical protein